MVISFLCSIEDLADSNPTSRSTVIWSKKRVFLRGQTKAEESDDPPVQVGLTHNANFALRLSCLENSICTLKIEITNVSSVEGDTESCDQISLNKSLFPVCPTDLVDHGSNSATKRDTDSENAANPYAWGSDFATTANGRYICERINPFLRFTSCS
jgi:hypothetical protein